MLQHFVTINMNRGCKCFVVSVGDYIPFFLLGDIHFRHLPAPDLSRLIDGCVFSHQFYKCLEI